jgi:cytidine deaminase
MSTDDLVEAARAARAHAYAPYSDFAMGAAVRTADGAVHPGALVENVSLGLAMCAERVAMFASVAAGAGRVTELALVAARTDGALTTPCGACLQVALELGGPEVSVVVADLGGAEERHRLHDLAPHLPRKVQPER